MDTLHCTGSHFTFGFGTPGSFYSTAIRFVSQTESGSFLKLDQLRPTWPLVTTQRQQITEPSKHHKQGRGAVCPITHSNPYCVLCALPQGIVGLLPGQVQRCCVYYVMWAFFRFSHCHCLHANWIKSPFPSTHALHFRRTRSWGSRMTSWTARSSASASMKPRRCLRRRPRLSL